LFDVSLAFILVDWGHRLTFAVRLLVGVTSLSGCCAPDTCYVATSRFDELDPVVSELEKFEQQNGRFPERLEELFPEGLPFGITPDRNGTRSYRFATEEGGFSTFYYGPAEGTIGSPLQSKSSDQVVALHFSYVGGGVLAGMND
jgi:hypothetical protein